MLATEDSAVRVRFAPSPTGYLHVGGARTALFNWLIARRSGGRFVLRIEDTDRTRHVEDSVAKICEDLRWLGLDWDEGPQVGGPYGPYFQSERLGIYQTYEKQLLAAGAAYYATETPEELEAMRARARAAKRPLKYRRPDRAPTEADAKRARAEGRPVVVRFQMPEADMTVEDRILGTVVVRREELEDFVIVKSDGFPTYHFACVVDDHLMGITDVLRGQEHLMNTPRHMALQAALGFATPRYAHLPLILNMDGSKMSKRDKEQAAARGQHPPEIDVHDFRASGYLPEVLVNFIALLGWSPGRDREKLTRDELIELFDIARIGRTAARFDREKLLAFNTDALNRAAADRRLAGLRDYIAVSGFPVGGAGDEKLLRLMKAAKGFRTFGELMDKSRFLFLGDDKVVYDEDAVAKVLHKGDGAGLAVLRELQTRLAEVEPFSAEELERLLRGLGEQRGVGLGRIAQPLRVAVSGGTISPPIFDSLELLGKEATLRRVGRCLARVS